MDEDRPSLGRVLREGRERSGLSIAEVARRTRIPEGTLRALEEDRMAEMPPTLYVRGFIRAFAREVVMPDGAPLELLDRLLAEEAAVVEGQGGPREIRRSTVVAPVGVTGRAPAVSFESRRRRAIAVIAAGVVLLVLLVFWALHHRSRSRKPPAEGDKPAAALFEHRSAGHAVARLERQSQRVDREERRNGGIAV